jgi:leucyl aminopeptidase
LPVDIEVITVAAAGPRPLDDYLAGPAGAVGIHAIAVPMRREACRAVADGTSGDGEHGAWPSVTGIQTEALASAAGMSAAEVIGAYELTGKAGETARLPVRTAAGVIKLLLIGVGDGSPAELRRAGAALSRQVESGQKAVAVLPADAPEDSVQAFTEGLLLGGYNFSLRSELHDPERQEDQTDGPGGAARAVQLLLPGADDDSPAGRAAVIAGAVALARDLINMPSARKTPEWLADQAVTVAGQCGLGVRVRNEAELASAGFGGILAVGSGSVRPPRMIELSYAPDRADSHIVLAGKGITFDSGGLSLKPSDGMRLMKTDMSGGAVVIAVMSALAALGVQARVTGLVAAAENMPSGSAMRPGDVISAYGGRTVEVLNTDAEGRLVLADLLAYADATLNPDVTVDIATLTGAARVALGASVGALYASDDGLAEALHGAGAAAGEPLWRMPMPADYADAITSVTADLAHVPSTINGARNGQAGSIVAAMFLREFTGGRPWAHLDIAGPARAAADDGDITKGGTGFGTRLLLRWLAELPDQPAAGTVSLPILNRFLGTRSADSSVAGQLWLAPAWDVRRMSDEYALQRPAHTSPVRGGAACRPAMGFRTGIPPGR